jgi:hypothetical protein
MTERKTIDHEEARRAAEFHRHGGGDWGVLARAYLDLRSKAEAVLRECDTISGDEEREALRACLEERP